ncbi:adaptin family protein [Cryptosporidium felis]|nr:adaptin family protein [Cryptosporidium felis]
MRKGGISIKYGDTVGAVETSFENQTNTEPFADHRSGEVNDLYEKLQDITLIKDREKRIDLFQKAIALMTLGVDVSSLYSLMVLASATQDQVEKKIIYLYLTYYAERNSELALLMVNTLRKDSQDEDPVIRSLALRSFSSLKIPIIVEYIEPILRGGLGDPIGYVRKTAVMGCLKFFQYSREDFFNTQLLDSLYLMLETELDPNTIVNLIYVLNEINKEYGGATFSREFVFKVLSNLKSFNEWAQFAILQFILQNLSHIVQSSSVSDPSQPPPLVFQVLNALEEVLRLSSTSVLLICIQIFISLTNPYPKLFFQVIQRIKSPIFTQAATSIPEVSITVYSHMRILFSFLSDFSREGNRLEDPNRQFYSSNSILFQFYDEYKLLFMRNGDPLYIQNIKLDLIPFLTSEESLETVLEELFHYSFELDDPRLVHKAVYLMSVVIIKHIQNLLDSFQDLPESCETVTQDKSVRDYLRYTRELLESEKEEVLSPALMGLELMCESFPWVVAETIQRYFGLELVEKLSFGSGGVSSFLWIMARLPEDVFDNKARILDYIVTGVIEVYEKDPSGVEKRINGFSRFLNILLTSCCRLLFDSPDDVRPVLGRLLSFAIERLEYPDVKDLALFYYRLLLFDHKVAKTIITDDSGIENRRRDPVSVCILRNYFYRWREEFPGGFNSCSAVSDIFKGVGEKIQFFGRYLDSEEAKNGAFEEKEVLTDHLQRKRKVTFNRSAGIEPEEFEKRWKKLSETFESETRLDSPLGPEDFDFMDSFENELAEEGLFCIASGEIDETSFKVFSYCELEDPDISKRICCLSETSISRLPSQSKHHITFKAKGYFKDQDGRNDSEVSSFCEEVWVFIVSTLQKHIRRA